MAATKPQIRSMFATPVCLHFLPVAQEANAELRPLILEKAQALLDEGMAVPEVGRELGVLSNTLHKAISAGRLRVSIKKKGRHAAVVRARKASAV